MPLIGKRSNAACVGAGTQVRSIHSVAFQDI